MSAADHVHPLQMSMWMPAGKLADPEQMSYLDMNVQGVHTHEVLQRTKLNRSISGSFRGTGFPKRDEPSLRDSIAAEGVNVPVTVSNWGMVNKGETKPRLLNGHHRVFAANDVDPKMEVPVDWSQ